MPIEKIYAVWVYANDLNESRKFYETALGLKFRFRDHDWIEFNLGATSFSLHQKAKGKAAPQKTRIMFQVDDIGQMRKRLAKNKVKMHGNIRNESYGKLLTFEDCNGHWLELFEPKAR